MPEVGDRVKPGRYEMVYEIDHVRQDGSQVDRGEQSEVARARSCPRLDQINSIREAGYDEDYSTFSARGCVSEDKAQPKARFTRHFDCPSLAGNVPLL